MISHLRPLLVLLLVCAAFFTDAALGQSLSISRNSSGEYWIEGAAPADTPHVLQASRNLHLWVDLTNVVSGLLSYCCDRAGVTDRYFRLAPQTPPAPPINVVLLGDSTVADFVSDSGWFNGWGQGIYGYFKPNVRVVNLAYPCYSTKVFLASDELTKMRVIKPDFVLVQFGTIDVFSCGGDPDQYLTTLQEYADNLKTIVQTIRGFNGTPILVTPPVPRQFDGNGKVVPWLTDRSAMVRIVATEQQTDLIDLSQMSMDLFNELGVSGSAYVSMHDANHYSAEGAKVMAGLVVNALPDSFGTYLVGVFNPPPPP